MSSRTLRKSICRNQLKGKTKVTQSRNQQVSVDFVHMIKIRIPEF